MAFHGADGALDVAGLLHVVDLVVTAQDLLVGLAGYPHAAIAETTTAYRPLMLGYANLGTVLMARGLPYDSERGRSVAAALTALMTGEAWAQSGRIAERLGPFPRFHQNREPLRRVLDRHVEALKAVAGRAVEATLREAADAAWQEARVRARTHGMRNAQVTALAPSATVALVMDCETVGVEPDLALVSVAKRRTGEEERVVHRAVPMALAALGYQPSQVRQILDHIEEQGTIEGAPGLDADHLPVFDCARRAQVGRRLISPEGHLRMMAALQPFVSGAVSKTVSLPQDATVDEVLAVFREAHRRGVKTVVVHREGSRRTQPRPSLAPDAAPRSGAPRRQRLPPERESITHKFSIAGHEGYITVGMYEDGSPGELFVNMAKAGSVVAGLMDSIALAVSLSLQYGVPLHVMVDKYAHSRFEPSGFTSNPEIPIAKSIIDYIFRWLALKFLDEDPPPHTADDDSAGTLFPKT
jgi:ribonucleoside-diphosphate reductase alpha chain